MSMHSIKHSLPCCRFGPYCAAHCAHYVSRIITSAYSSFYVYKLSCSHSFNVLSVSSHVLVVRLSLVLLCCLLSAVCCLLFPPSFTLLSPLHFSILLRMSSPLSPPVLIISLALDLVSSFIPALSTSQLHSLCNCSRSIYLVSSLSSLSFYVYIPTVCKLSNVLKPHPFAIPSRHQDRIWQSNIPYHISITFCTIFHNIRKLTSFSCRVAENSRSPLQPLDVILSTGAFFDPKNGTPI